jgi:hypothetical protein
MDDKLKIIGREAVITLLAFAFVDKETLRKLALNSETVSVTDNRTRHLPTAWARCRQSTRQ